ncbi:MAG: hypothetical protein ACEY3D_03695 [Rickettsia sp.]|uniref:hypothetical protein n=1 Tax=Rickettsia sp. TaxID=789 RepID=UPI00397A7E62
MSRKESKKNKLNDFHKTQLANHREVFSKVEPIITGDGKDQGHQNNNIKAKKENKIMRAISKLFGVSRQSSKKVVTDKGSKLDQNNNRETQDAIEEKLKHMNSKEVLQFLNKDEIQPSEISDKGNVKVNSVNIEDQIKNMDSKQILEFLNRDSLEGSKNNSLESSKIQDKQDTAIDVENKIKHMNSAEILQFLNTDEKIVSTNEVTTKGKVAVERKETVSWVSTITQSKSNQDRVR